MKLTDFKVLSFDCYGTLIDWETGLWAALQPLIESNRSTISRDATLETFGALESEQQAQTPNLLYRDLLARVHATLAAQWSAPPNEARDRAFGASIGNWPAFPDSAQALAYLKRHYKLVILSNVDRQSFAASNKKLAVAFDAIRTAEDIGSYKPNPKNFEDLIATVRALGHDKSEILHTAQSLFHDHAPAERIGLARCWINRRGDKGEGSGATRPVAAIPKLDFEFPTLAAMAEQHKREQEAGR
ncbi:MAG: haloacid dehalogenase type II [Alphaproteobacteria bacterium]|nr:haloacid dehalogenase type II [Alphaproteobacteria bacterium]